MLAPLNKGIAKCFWYTEINVFGILKLVFKRGS
jgi:hypothetical protein